MCCSTEGSQQTWSGFSPTTVPDNNRQSGFSPTTVPKLSTGVLHTHITDAQQAQIGLTMHTSMC